MARKMASSNKRQKDYNSSQNILGLPHSNIARKLKAVSYIKCQTIVMGRGSLVYLKWVTCA